MKSTLVMNFKLDNGKITTISITSPWADLTEAEVKEVANAMVAKDVFHIGSNHLEALDRAFIRTVEETPLP